MFDRTSYTNGDATADRLLGANRKEVRTVQDSIDNSHATSEEWIKERQIIQDSLIYVDTE